MALALPVLGAVALSSAVPGNAMKKMPFLQAPRQRGDGRIFLVLGAERQSTVWRFGIGRLTATLATAATISRWD